VEPSRYWDAIGGTWQASRPQRLWRAWSDLVHTRLCERWLPPVGRILKTDLFDEAAGEGLGPWLAARTGRAVGIDVSRRMLEGADGAHLARVGADVRRLPFASASFDAVLSNSTLDHFDALPEIGSALAELTRVLRPGGELLLTLDNLANPAVALRNALPAGLLLALRVIPYRMGACCGPARLRALVEAAGLEVLELGTLMHAPRLPAVALAGVVDRLGSRAAARALLRGLQAWERLGGWPTRFLTGYFLVVRARRRGTAAPPPA
jgi:SAM-dependent methyltransferase